MKSRLRRVTPAAVKKKPPIAPTKGQFQCKGTCGGWFEKQYFYYTSQRRKDGSYGLKRFGKCMRCYSDYQKQMKWRKLLEKEKDAKNSCNPSALGAQ